MKTIAAIIAIMVILVSLAACGNDEKPCAEEGETMLRLRQESRLAGGGSHLEVTQRALEAASEYQRCLERH